MNTAEINLGLVIHDGRAVVSSRDIARVFERRHDNVLRDIRNIIDDDAEWGLLNLGDPLHRRTERSDIPGLLRDTRWVHHFSDGIHRR